MSMVVGGVMTVAQVLKKIPLSKLGTAIGILSSKGLSALIAWAVIELGLEGIELIGSMSSEEAKKLLQRRRRRRRRLLDANTKRILAFVDANFEGKLAQSMRAMILQKAG